MRSIGPRVYGGGAIAIGLVGLAWGRFADLWQPIQAFGDDVPHRELLAYIFAACFLLGGIAIQWRRAAIAGIVFVTALHAISAGLWLPRVIGFPQIYGVWAGFSQEFSLVAAGLVGCGLLATRQTPAVVAIAEVGRVLYGICVINYGIVHFYALPQTAAMVPRWLFPGQTFWAVATGVFDFLAAVSILTRIFARIGSRLLTAMLIGFGVFVWAPRPFYTPHDHIAWAGNAMNLAFISAAWVIADWMAARRAVV
jgi:uncharacterized membrane protein YphA (DoxX/SURF4 family)